MVNSTMSPIAKSIAVVKRSLPPHMVSVQLTIFTPVGIAISIVLTENTATLTAARPLANMWWAPHPPADEADGRAGEHDELVTEERFSTEHRQHLADDAEAGQDEDVHLRVPEYPK